MKQYVWYSDNLSATMPITHAVPQGSILGPLLFILYINDLANVSENLFSILFANDTTVLIEGTNINTMIGALNCELAKLTEWLNANKLSISVSKSHYNWRWTVLLLSTCIFSLLLHFCEHPWLRIRFLETWCISHIYYYYYYYMVFHRSRRKINKGDILLDTTILSQVTFTKFLGLILDDKLK